MSSKVQALQTQICSAYSFCSSNTNSTYKSLIAITTVVISGPIIAPCAT